MSGKVFTFIKIFFLVIVIKDVRVLIGVRRKIVRLVLEVVRYLVSLNKGRFFLLVVRFWASYLII